MSILIGRAARFRPPLMPVPLCTYGYGKYPERIRMSFKDGKTRVYETPVQQPSPMLVTKQELNRMYKESGGYRIKEGLKARWKRLRSKRSRTLKT